MTVRAAPETVIVRNANSLITGTGGMNARNTGLREWQEGHTALSFGEARKGAHTLLVFVCLL